MPLIERQAFRFFDRLRVRWAEVDMQKIVFNGHYLMYFDTAVASYWRALALPYHETMAHLDGDLFVRKATVEYHASARYDDLLEVGIRTARIGNSSMLFEAAVFRGEQLLISGELVYVFANPATQTSLPVPDALREVLLGYEAGQPMLELRVGTWAELGTVAAAVRRQVLVDEAQLPAAGAGAGAGAAGDDDDAQALHAVACNRFGLALATGRLVQAAPGVGQIDRMAVMTAMRGGGVGRQVLDALVAQAKLRGDHEVLLQASATAVPFYLNAGFARHGAAVAEAGLTHQQLSRAI